MKYFFLFVTIIILFSTCKKDERPADAFDCKWDTPTRIPGNRYNIVTNPINEITYNTPHCGYLPLNKNNYWVYLDSSFTTNGVFISSLTDTLRFEKTYQSADSIVWWEPRITIVPHHRHLFKGYYERMYSTDSVLYTLGELIFGYRYTIKWCYPVYTDSVYDNCTWTDVPSSTCYGKKLTSNVVVPAGSFAGCNLFIKKHTVSPRAHIYYKQGIGILRSVFYRHDEPITPSFDPIVYTSTLISYHIE